MQLSDIRPEVPTEERLRAEYDNIAAALDASATVDALCSAIQDWETLRRGTNTYASMVHLRFAQDVRDPERKAAKEDMDRLEPVRRECDVRIQTALLRSPLRAELTKRYGRTAFDLWECGVTTFDPAIADDMVEEAGLVTKLTELQARAQIEFEGELRTLSWLRGTAERDERSARLEGARAVWGWFEQEAETHDEVFDQLTRLRHRMARKLGFDSYIGLGYRNMSRVDYNRVDVERFRAQVRADLVPLCSEIRRRQASKLGIDEVMLWDEQVFSVEENPRPLGGEQWMIDRAGEMFEETHPEIAAFFDKMVRGGFLDLSAREGKAGGGFCTDFPSAGYPFIFANFNGTSGDVRVFTHEAGHAFQCWMSRGQPLTEYLWPTIEACEIHSMSLEFLTYPSMHRFFGDRADRFVHDHLAQALLFIPYGVAVDHFQHLVYERPTASPKERRQMWLQMEATYLPWRNYGGLPHVATGGYWQRQQHIYHVPFYYIDYALAQTCALQFWNRSLSDRDLAIEAYVELCKRGGEVPFQELARSAGLRSPFDDGCLAAVVERASAVLL